MWNNLLARAVFEFLPRTTVSILNLDFSFDDGLMWLHLEIKVDSGIYSHINRFLKYNYLVCQICLWIDLKGKV